MGYCSDCGSRTSGGICSNCQEELYIVTNQSEDITEPLSNEFTDKAKEQKEYLKQQKRIKETI